jgi:uncharacterized Zn finger protein
MGIAHKLMLEFRCYTCGTTRPFGEANGKLDRPTESSPKLNCGECGTVTPHRFDKTADYKMTYDRNGSGAITNVSFSAALMP